MYTSGGMSVIMQWEQARELLQQPHLHALNVYATPGQRAALGEELRKYVGDKGLFLQSHAEFRHTVQVMIDQIE